MNSKSASLLIVVAAIAALLCGCNERKSYAQLLTDENISANSFLADHMVVPYEERDSTFQFDFGPDAPYYELDPEGNVYMQVVNPGTKGNRAVSDQLIYFRFMRYSLHLYKNGQLGDGQGNAENIASGDASFRYANMEAYNSYQWGTGIQMPLYYLPIDCEVNIVIKSQFGPYNEIATVVPYLYKVRYFKSQI